MTKLLQPPIQSQNITDKDGKPTSHYYRWLDGITGDVSTLNTDVSTLQTTVTNNFANAPGTAPLFYCRAWVNFDGTRNAAGTSIIDTTNRFLRGSGNVSSVLRNALGVYTINFTTALPDANYAVVGFSSNNDDGTNESYVVSRQATGTYTALACQITNTENFGGLTGRGDSNIINVLFFR